MANFDTINATAGNGFTADIGGFMRVNSEAQELRSAINESQAVIAERLQAIQTQILSPDQQTDTITSLQAQQGQLDTWAASLSETNLWANGNAQETIWGVQEAIRTELGSGDDTRNRYLQNLRNLVSIGHEHRAMSEREAARAEVIRQTSNYLAEQGFSEQEAEAAIQTVESLGLATADDPTQFVRTTQAAATIQREAPVIAGHDVQQTLANATPEQLEDVRLSREEFSALVSETLEREGLSDIAREQLNWVQELIVDRNMVSEPLRDSLEQFANGEITESELRQTMKVAITNSVNIANESRTYAFERLPQEQQQYILDTLRASDPDQYGDISYTSAEDLESLSPRERSEALQVNSLILQGASELARGKEGEIDALYTELLENPRMQLTSEQQDLLTFANYEDMSTTTMATTSAAIAIQQLSQERSISIADAATEIAGMTPADLANFVTRSSGQEFTQEELQEWQQFATMISQLPPEHQARIPAYFETILSPDRSPEAKEAREEVLNEVYSIICFGSTPAQLEQMRQNNDGVSVSAPTRAFVHNYVNENGRLPTPQEVNVFVNERINESLERINAEIDASVSEDNERRLEELTTEMALEMDTAFAAQQEAQEAEVDARMEQMFADMEAEQQASMERRMQAPDVASIPGVNPDEFATLESADVTDSGELTPSNAPAQEQEQTRGAALSS
ncbi:MAG: hypothetical protein CMM94_07805 [Rickettsiales bacterium]|nr:hypothetical protein [Rickettsiales bacterium]